MSAGPQPRPLHVVLLAVLLFGWNLGGYDVWAPDEPYFAEGAREMVDDGEWLVPHVNGQITTDKPPLHFWSIALVSLALGGEVTSLTARLPSMLAMLGTLALVLSMAGRRYGPGAAGWAGLVLATAFMPWDKARSAQIDATLALLVTAALWAFDRFRAGEMGGRAASAVFWAAAALATLAKGPVGFLLPLFIALLTLVWDGRRGLWRRFAPVQGLLVFLTIVGAWVAAASVWGGEYSVWGSLREHFVERGLRGMHHAQPFWYYAKVLPVYLMPWSFLVPGALLHALRRATETDRLLLVWCGFVVLFFSVSSEKRDLYVLPAFPAFAMLVGRLVAEPPTPRWVTIPLRMTALLLAVLGLALSAAPAVPAAARSLPAGLGPVVVGVGAAILAGGVLTAILTARARAHAAVLSTGITLAVVYLVAAGWLFPALDPVKSSRRFALELASRSRGAPVVAFHLGNLPEAFAFHTRGLYVQETYDPVLVARHLEGQADAWLVADADRLGELPETLQQELVIEARARLSRREVVLARRAAPSPRGQAERGIVERQLL